MSCSDVIENLEDVAKSLDKDGCADIATECREMANGFRRIDKMLNSL